MNEITDLTDDELMTRGASGDQDSLRILIERWETPVFAFLERMLGSSEEAQEIAQETFFRMCSHADRYRPSGRFRSWLFRIAGNLARSKLRRRAVLRFVRFDTGIHTVPTVDSMPDHSLEYNELREHVRNALSRISPRQRQALVLRHYHDMSYQEIADTMKTTVSAVESLLHRGMNALKMDFERRKVFP